MVYKAFWDTFWFTASKCSFKWHGKSVRWRPAVTGRTSLHLTRLSCGDWIGVLWFSTASCGGMRFSGGPWKCMSKGSLYQSINQSIFIWVRQKPIQTHTHTPIHKTQPQCTIKETKKKLYEMKHIYIVRCQIQLTFLTRLFTEQFNLVVRRTRALWSRVEKHGKPSSNSITVTLLNFA